MVWRSRRLRTLTDSQFNLGVLSEHGLGLPKEPVRCLSVVCTGGGGPGHSRAGRRGLETEGPTSEANGVDERPEWSEGSTAPNTALVNRAQNLLNKLGYDAGMADGLMGAQTRDAIKSFERKNGLEETGKVTIPLVAKLERRPADRPDGRALDRQILAFPPTR